MNSLKDVDFSIPQHSTLTELPGAFELLNKRALAGGKRFRPELFCLVGESLGVEATQLIPYATLAERLHNATLLHDDVIDESPERRGRPTLNSNGHNHRAVLAGDLLLAVGLREIANHANSIVMKDVLSVLVELVEGEWLQLESKGSCLVDERHLRSVAEKKTASLIAWCLYGPGRIAELSEESIYILRLAGIHLGIAFQMADDCLDFSLSSGKPWGQDLKERQMNFVTLTLKESNPSLNQELKSFIEEGSSLAPTPEFKKEIEKSIERVARMIRNEIKASQHLLGSLPELKKASEAIHQKIFVPLLEASYR